MNYCTKMTVNGICEECHTDSGSAKVVIDGPTIGTCECSDGYFKDAAGSCNQPCIPNTILVPGCIKCKSQPTLCTLCTGSTSPILDSGPLGKCECGPYLYRSGDHCVPCNGGSLD